MELVQLNVCGIVVPGCITGLYTRYWPRRDVEAADEEEDEDEDVDVIWSEVKRCQIWTL